MADFHYHMARYQVEDGCGAEQVCELVMNRQKLVVDWLS